MSHIILNGQSVTKPHTHEMTFSHGWSWTSFPFAMCCRAVWYICANVAI